MSIGLASRTTAHRVLIRIFKQKETAEQAMAAESNALDALSGSDRGLVYQLVMSVLRYHGSCAALLTFYLRDPIKENRLDITLCLHLGIVQLMILQSAPHAVVDTSVELAKKLHQPLSGLVNAVLKKIAQQGKAEWDKLNHPHLNTPDWLWESWEAAYGAETAKAIATAHLQEPPTDITLRHSRAGGNPDDKWIPAYAGMTVEKLSDYSLRLHGSPAIPSLEGFAEGRWWVQDYAASLPVPLMGNLAGKEVLDICAAPGGKTAQLASLGAKVTALDISENRLKRLRENLERLQLSAEIIVADVMKWQPPHLYDAILLDAPCSATGTLRRHPEIALLRSPQDVARLVATQHKMLRHAWDWLKPEGILTYVTCSLQPEEGEWQIDSFLKEINAEIIGEPLRTLPSHLADKGGMDGFYAVCLKKV
jgi:16S rRNA (cytosine967-C5)-methyltransferase